MDFLNLAKKRFSVRSFADKKVEQEKVDLILDAACAAPTACNFQPQKILVLNDERSLTKLKGCTPYHFEAPLVFVICYDNTKSWKRREDAKEEGEVDASIVATHMMLEATDLDLGCTWVGSFNPETLRKQFNIPKNYIPVSILPVGYKNENVKPNPIHHNRLSKSEFTYYNSFNSQCD
ncbi:MAG: nitroreductase family protein [Candidatus Gastranaerophilales bacterium]|nr:nitroreductase family protein [Candidatus Gastranaerophilales bacterium]